MTLREFERVSERLAARAEEKLRERRYIHADGTECDIPRENTLTADGRQACHMPEEDFTCKTEQPSEYDRLMAQAARLRDLAARA